MNIDNICWHFGKVSPYHSNLHHSEHAHTLILCVEDDLPNCSPCIVIHILHKLSTTNNCGQYCLGDIVRWTIRVILLTQHKPNTELFSNILSALSIVIDVNVWMCAQAKSIPLHFYIRTLIGDEHFPISYMIVSNIYLTIVIDYVRNIREDFTQSIFSYWMHSELVVYK